MKHTMSMLRKHRAVCIFCMLLSCLQAALELLLPITLAAIIKHGIPACNAAYILYAALIAAAGAILALICATSVRHLYARTAARISFTHRKALFYRCQSESSLPDIDAVESYTHILHLFCCISKMAIILGYIFYISTSAAIAILLFTPALFAAHILLIHRADTAQLKLSEAKEELSAFMRRLEFSHRALGRTGWQKSTTAHFHELEDIHAEHFIAAKKYKSKAVSFMRLGNTLLYIVAAAIAALSCITSSVAIAQIPALLFCIRLYSLPLCEIPETYLKLTKALTATQLNPKYHPSSIA